MAYTEPSVVHEALILYLLRSGGPATEVRLAEYANLPLSSATEALARLRAQGLVMASPQSKEGLIQLVDLERVQAWFSRRDPNLEFEVTLHAGDTIARLYEKFHRRRAEALARTQLTPIEVGRRLKCTPREAERKIAKARMEVKKWQKGSGAQ